MIPTPCGTYAFYGWKINMYGWIRFVNKVQSIWVAATVTMIHVSRDAASLIYGILMRGTKAAFISAMEEQGLSQCSRGSKTVRKQQTGTLSAKQDLFPPRMSTTDVKPHLKTVKASERIRKDMELAQVSREAASANHTILRKVFRAEQYLDSLYSIYIAEDAVEKTPGSNQRHCIAPKRKKPRFQCLDQTPYYKCLWAQTIATLTNRPSANVRNILYFHGLATGNHAAHQMPRLVSRMYNLALSDPPPDWQFLKIASDIHLSKVSLHILPFVRLNVEHNCGYIRFPPLQPPAHGQLMRCYNSSSSFYSSFKLNCRSSGTGSVGCSLSRTWAS